MARGPGRSNSNLDERRGKLEGMARRKAATVTKEKGVTIVQTAPAPVTRRRRSSGAVTTRRRKGGVRRHRSGGIGGSDKTFRDTLIGVGIGGFGFGWLMKHYANQIPTLPMVGKSGTIAIASYFFRGQHKVVRDIGVAAAAIAGYSFGKTGAVEGELPDEE